MAKALEVRKLSDDALRERLAGRERELVQLRFKLSTNQLENSSTISGVRKDIARIRTEARAREAQRGLAKDTLLANLRAAAPSGVSSAPADEAKGGFLRGIVDKLAQKE